MEGIIYVECDDCGPAIISEPDYVSLSHLEGTYSASTICVHCERPIVCQVEPEDALDIVGFGVKLFDWQLGEIKKASDFIEGN